MTHTHVDPVEMEVQNSNDRKTYMYYSIRFNKNDDTLVLYPILTCLVARTVVSLRTLFI